jgi:hypothetical protein
VIIPPYLTTCPEISLPFSYLFSATHPNVSFPSLILFHVSCIINLQSALVQGLDRKDYFKENIENNAICFREKEMKQYGCKTPVIRKKHQIRRQ